MYLLLFREEVTSWMSYTKYNLRTKMSFSITQWKLVICLAICGVFIRNGYIGVIHWIILLPFKNYHLDVENIWCEKARELKLKYIQIY